jgi:hypothetical protein
MWLFLFILYISILSCSHALVADTALRIDVRMRDLTAQLAMTPAAPQREPYSPPYNGPKAGNKQHERRPAVPGLWKKWKRHWQQRWFL